MSNPADNIPQYRLLEPAFYAPDWLPAGSIIATEAPPGPHLEPWNDAAVEAMEAWLTAEFDEIDPVTKKATGRKTRPRERYRRVYSDGSEQQTATVVLPPEREDNVGQTLAELSVRKPTDQRPPASRRFNRISPVEPKAVAVLAKGPKDTTVTGGPT